MNDDEETSTAGTPTADGRTVRNHWDEETAPSVAVIEAVAATTGLEPTEMPPLQRTVDVEALDDLLRSRPDSSVRLSFEYAGMRVTVVGDGGVELSAP